MTQRDYDLVLLGATGFTGGLAAAHLGEQLAGTATRWAIAGRDATKLAARRATLSGEPAVEVVDVGDLVGLIDLAGRTRVLATTVGPFARLGELVVQACVRAGTHYTDTTGEPAFVRLIAGRYHDDAQRRGVAVVPCCAFESVPADLGTHLAVAHLPDDAAIDIRGYMRARARFSGSTARTAVEAIAARDLGRPRWPDEAERARPVSSLPARVHRADDSGAWALPAPTIDGAIVLRSASVLDGYGTAFRYGHYLQAGGLAKAVGQALGLAAFGGASSLPPTRAVLRRVLPGPGQGPSAPVRARSRFTVTLVGSGGRRRVVVRVSGGDPGYDATAVMLGEAARWLAEHPHPPPKACGVTTPAIALGDGYRQRLCAHGIAFDVVDES